MVTEIKFSKIKSKIFPLVIVFVFFVVLAVLPFLFLWAGFWAKDVQCRISLQKKSVQTSVFVFQKVYTRNSILPLLVLTGDYSTAIKYFEQLEKLGAMNTSNASIAVYSYMKMKDYDNALKYAEIINDKSRLVQIYLIKKEYAKAGNIIDELMSKDSVKVSTYYYKSELLNQEGKTDDALYYVQKALSISPAYVDALYLKSALLAKTGRIKESNEILSKAKHLESYRENIYK